MNKSGAITQLRQALRDSHFDIVSLSEKRLELRGHNRNNLAILPTLMYGLLPIIGVFYFWNKKDADIIVGLCALLFIIVLVVRFLSMVNTKMSFIQYDHDAGLLSFRNADVRKEAIPTSAIERISSSLTLITNSRYAHKKWHIANVEMFTTDGTKLIVAQFEAEMEYQPTRQATALGQLFEVYLGCPYQHSEELTVI